MGRKWIAKGEWVIKGLKMDEMGNGMKDLKGKVRNWRGSKEINREGRLQWEGNGLQRGEDGL